MNLSIILFSLIVSYLSCLFFIYEIIEVSNRFDLYDLNDTYRKNKLRLTSRLGGVAIFASCSLSIAFLDPCLKFQTIAYLSSMLIIFLVGLKDDLLGGAGPYEKLFMQILAVVIMFDFCDLRIFSVSSKELQFYSCLDLAIVVFLMLIVINSFNFIDGINGLSGMIGLVSNLSFGCYTNDSSFALISFSMVGAIAGFLTLNFTKGKVFMGDTGAMLIGFGTAVGAFRFVNMKSDGIAFNGDIGFRLMLVFVLLIIPVLDLIRVTLIRFFHGKSLFVGDRNHIHHKIKDLGFKDTQVVSILMAFNLLMFVVAFKTNEKWPYSWCFILPIIFALCHTVLTFLNGKRRSAKYKFRDVFFKDTLGLH